MRKHVACAGAALAFFAAGVGADDKGAGKDRLVVQKDVLAFRHGDGPPLEDHALAFVWAHEGLGGRAVKGAPYAADAVTETVQTLSDGNRIVRRTSAQVARDGVGRTRREHALAAVGPWLAAGDEPRTVFIDDPVGGVHYVLHPSEKSARRFKAPAGGEGGAPGVFEEAVEVIHAGPGPTIHDEAGAEEGPPEKDVRIVQAPMAGVRAFHRRLPEPKEEPLGRQTIEGVEADGTRTSFTIGAGEIGNERPIEVVSERWYSPELQVIVMSRHSDPRFGETTYRLANLTRGEPERSLFEVPAGYKVDDGPERKVIRLWKEPRAPKP